MLCHTGIHWNHKNCNKRTKKISGNNTRKAFNRFSTKNITHYKESATIRNLKPEWWGFTIGSRGKVPGETCEKMKINNNNKIIIII
jgi:hypothetical protein